MPTAPIWPTIPVPREDLQSLNAAVVAIKQAVEMLTGQDNSDKFAAHVFLQPTTPEAHNDGDLWLSMGDQSSLNIWNGTIWLKVADVVPVAASQVNFNLAQFVRKHR